MKTLRQTVLPVLAGLMFGLSAWWMIGYRLSGIFYSFFEIPIYLFLVIACFLRRRNHMLTAGALFMIAARVVVWNVIGGYADTQPDWYPLWRVVTGAYLVGTVLLLAIVLVNVTPPLKRYRPAVNPLWFLPGGVMLAGVVVYGLMASSVLGISPALGMASAVASLNSVGTPLFDAAGTLLIPLWLKLCAADDLQPYEELVGRVLTPEQLEEKRRELGLTGRKTRA